VNQTYKINVMCIIIINFRYSDKLSMCQSLMYVCIEVINFNINIALNGYLVLRQLR